MSRLRQFWVRFRNPHATIIFGPGTYLGPGFSLDMPFGGHFVTAADVEFRRGFRAELAAPDAAITIGKGSIFTYSVLIQCTTSIEIGARCVFAQSALVVDGQHRFRGLDRPMVEQGYNYRNIRIGDDASVMSKCSILASIGERSFIGANAVVSRDIPAFSLAVGVPARVIEYFGPEKEIG